MELGQREVLGKGDPSFYVWHFRPKRMPSFFYFSYFPNSAPPYPLEFPKEARPLTPWTGAHISQSLNVHQPQTLSDVLVPSA